jgi:hypothetical protein
MYLMGPPQLVHLSVLVISGVLAVVGMFSDIYGVSPALPAGLEMYVYYWLEC